MATILLTSLLEIYQHGPCTLGWRKILRARGKTQADSELFPLADCVASNGFADVCWLLEKRRTEIKIVVSAANKVADSVKHLQTTTSLPADAAYAAAAAAAYAAATADADAYAAACAADAAYAAYAADAAYAAAAYAAAYADTAYAAEKQKTLNCQLLLEAIHEYEATH